MRIAFATEPGRHYEIEFNDDGGLGAVPDWDSFIEPGAGTYEEVGVDPSTHVFVDTFGPDSSGYAPAEGYRMYRVSVGLMP